MTIYDNFLNLSEGSEDHTESVYKNRAPQMDPKVSNGANFRCPPGTATWTMTIRSEGLDGHLVCQGAMGGATKSWYQANHTFEHFYVCLVLNPSH